MSIYLPVRIAALTVVARADCSCWKFVGPIGATISHEPSLARVSNPSYYYGCLGHSRRHKVGTELHLLLWLNCAFRVGFQGV